MQRINKKWIISTVVLLSAVIIYLAHWQYFRGLSSTERLNSEKQLLLTRQIAQSIQHHLQDRQKDLRVLASYTLINKFKGRICEKEYILIRDKLAGKRRIFYIDQNRKLSALDPRQAQLITEIEQKQINQKADFLFSAEAADSGIVLLINPVPSNNQLLLYQTVYGPNGKKQDILFDILDLQHELDYLVTGKIERDTHTYILDKNGMLLYHSQHPEMIFRSVLSADSSCSSCHKDFEAELQILHSESGWLEKYDHINVKKMASFVGFQALGNQWKLVVDTPYEIYVQGNREQFWAFFLLSFLMVLIISSGGFLLSKLNHQLNEAEHKSHLQQTQLQYTEYLAEAEEKYRTLIEQSLDAILIYQEGKIVFANPSFFSMFGYSEQDFEQNQFEYQHLTTEQDLEKLRKRIRWLIDKDEKIASMPFSGIKKNGDPLELELIIGRISLQKKIAYNIVLHDVTESKQKEREHQRQQNLATIGIMSTRIAHEIKNPLASIQTGIRLVETLLPDDQENKSYFQNLVEEVQRVDNIVKSMLSLARDEKIELKRFNLNILAQRVLDLIKLTLDDQTITIELETLQKEVFVVADEEKIEQVMWNILLNAVEAMNKSGKIILKIERTEQDVKLLIIDDGHGIPNDKLDQVMQPFFSTKSRGNGLGLAISNKIIQAHGGQMEIKSTLESGTTILITIPEKYK